MTKRRRELLQLSPNFHAREFRCHNIFRSRVPTRYLPDLRRLCVEYLEPLRKAFGPCTVNSGYRTGRYNRSIGGASASFHVYPDRKPGSGVAADVTFAKGSVSDWHTRAQQLRAKLGNKGGIGFYPQGGFVHIDNRTYKADWNGS